MKILFMPLIIAHRANLDGPSSEENSPDAIRKALSNGFDVEIDVRSQNGELWLGHDAPTYRWPIDLLFTDRRLWIHAKDQTALAILLTAEAQTFAHDADPCALTSTGYIWCHPHHLPQHQYYSKRSILLLFDRVVLPIPKCHAICTDYPVALREALEN